MARFCDHCGPNLEEYRTDWVCIRLPARKTTKHILLPPFTVVARQWCLCPPLAVQINRTRGLRGRLWRNEIDGLVDGGLMRALLSSKPTTKGGLSWDLRRDEQLNDFSGASNGAQTLYVARKEPGEEGRRGGIQTLERSMTISTKT